MGGNLEILFRGYVHTLVAVLVTILVKISQGPVRASKSLVLKSFFERPPDVYPECFVSDVIHHQDEKSNDSWNEHLKAKNNQVVRFEIEFHRRKRVLNKHRNSREASADDHCQSSGQVRQVEAVRSIPVFLIILQLVMPHSDGNINVYDDACQENENEGNVLSGQVAIFSRVGS